MGRDRTLAPSIGEVDAETGIPRRSVFMVSGIVVVILVLVPDVATAGAASSLIFLVTFALARCINILVHRRMDPSAMPFRMPGFPLVPIAGGMSCMGLAFFQGVSVPVAVVITVMWLTTGVGLYAFRFAGRGPGPLVFRGETPGRLEAETTSRPPRRDERSFAGGGQ